MSELDEDFAAMFEASFKAKRYDSGQTLEGTIVAIGPEVAFVDIGGKGEATIEVSELKDADGALEVAVGDRIQAMVLSTAGGVTLSRRLARGAATDRQLENAFNTGLPVEGKVERVIKGGYEVRIGRQRAFCPMSQIDTARLDPSSYEGQVYTFRITEFKEGGQNLVVSRRALLEEEQRAAAVETRRALVAGRGDDRAGDLGPRVRRVRRPRRRRAGPAARLRDGLVARVGHRAGRHGGR